MKKELLISIICFSSLLFSSCGSKTVKVKFTNDEYVSWGKTEDTAKVGQDYVVTAIPKRGYWLYQENLKVVINGLPRFENIDYTFDEDNQKVTILKSSISGTIEIDGKAEDALKTVYLKLIVPDEYYSGISSTSEQGEPHDITSGFSANVTSKNGNPLIKPTIYPSDVNYNFDIEGGKITAKFSIDKSEFYRDITVTFPKLQ